MNMGSRSSSRATPIPKQSVNMTQEQLNHPDTDGCILGCPFWKPLHNHDCVPCFCAYLLMTGHVRGCKTADCNIQQRMDEFRALPEAAKRPYGHQSFCDPGIIPEYDEAVGM